MNETDPKKPAKKTRAKARTKAKARPARPRKAAPGAPATAGVKPAKPKFTAGTKKSGASKPNRAERLARSEEIKAGPSKAKRPARLAQGERTRATVTAWTDDGVALAETTIGPVHVVGGVPGDVGDVRILAKGQHQTWAVIDEEALEVSSPERVKAPCPVVLRCGGCPWQMVAIETQRTNRRASLERRLGAAADPSGGTTWHDLLAAPDAFGFRTRATVVLRHLGGRLRAGFYEPRSQNLVPAETCAVQHPLVNAIVQQAVKRLVVSNLPTWRSSERPGILRALVVRVDPERGKGLLSLVVSQDDPRLAAVGAALMHIDGVVGAFAVINPRPSGPLAAGELVHLGGATTLAVRVGADQSALSIPVGPLAFTQTHAAAAEQMIATVGTLLPAHSAHLVDLYAGVGIFGLALRDKADRVTLVERSPDAVAAAKAAVATLSEDAAVTVVEADASAAAAEVIGDGAATTVILDPPRSGCRPDVLAAIQESAVETVIYVSCGPKALTRDLAQLKGFTVTDVVEVEMFPHTPHAEAIVKLVRQPATP